MKSELSAWRSRLLIAKREAKDCGRINGDADLAEKITELLEAEGLPKVERGAVNHWLKGRNSPSMIQFLALCKALGVKPSEAISETKATPQQARNISVMPDRRKSDDGAQVVIELFDNMSDFGKGMAIGKMRDIQKEFPKPNSANSSR